jgi:hypothetical protein
MNAGQAMDDRIDMSDLLRAVSECVAAAPVEKRKHLAGTLEGYQFEERTTWAWAVGGSSPMLLAHLLFEIERACQPEEVEQLSEQAPRGTA